MKLTTSQINAFLQKPDPTVRIILVYGPDAGLVRERAETLAKKSVPDIHDPFSVASLPSSAISEDPARLADEMASQSLMGGRRLVRVPQVLENMAGALQALIANPPPGDGLLLLEAGDLEKRSKVRSACENAALAVAIPCYIESGPTLQRIVNELLQAEGLSVPRDVLLFLCDILPPDRLAMRSEIDKLVLYAQGQAFLTMNDIMAVIHDAGSAELDDLVFAVGGGEARRAAKLIDRLFSEQTSGVAILRATQRHFFRLQWVRHHISLGLSSTEAVKKLQPPVFWKYEESMVRQINRWPATKINRALHALYETEAAIKRSGSNEATLCSQLLLGMAS